MENNYKSNQMVPNGNNYIIKTETEIQVMPTSNRITTPQEVMIQTMEMSM